MYKNDLAGQDGGQFKKGTALSEICPRKVLSLLLIGPRGHPRILIHSFAMNYSSRT